MKDDIENRANLIQDYHRQVSQAGTEAAKKERFISLLTQLFGKTAPDIVSQFTAGAEKSIDNISRVRTGSEHGRADTQYANVIIEFEKDLSRTGSHAEDQLKEYLSGNWNSGIRSRFTLITTDCLNWHVYTLDYPSLFGLDSLKATQLKLEIKENFRVDPKNPDDFYFFLDRFLCRTEAVPATLEDIRRRFGHGSDIFQAVMIHMEKAYRAVENTPEMKVALDQWERLLRIAYGRFDASTHIFLIHSYLSVLAKMIAYEVITQDDFIDDSETEEILSGEAFKRRNIANFTENDFYRWVARPDQNLKEAFRVIADGLAEMDFSNVREDILKGVYQELIDDDTRHDLGEYYTPDWLCARVVEEVGPKPGQRILDPSCGSGSFLKAVANRLISLEPDISASTLNSCLFGIDVHPLSVLIAKATMLITYGSRLAAETEPLHLNIFLANALLLPKEDVQQLMGGNYRITVDSSQVHVPSTAFRDTSFFEKIVMNAERLAEIDFKAGNDRPEMEVMDIFANRHGISDKEITRSAAQLHARLLKAKKMNRNGIWAYILINLYAPVALKDSFDLVIGNPPWLTFKNIKVADYQEEIRLIAQRTGVMPESKALNAQLELAAVFVGHCADFFLKPGGKLAFVMPRSIFSADQHHKMREGKIHQFEVSGLWDLFDVSPLFKVPSCVLFGRKVLGSQDHPKAEIAGREFSGEPGASGKRALKDREITYYLDIMNDRTAWNDEPIHLEGDTPYSSKFRNGATLIPRGLCFVDIDQKIAGPLENRIVRVRTAKAVLREAKKPWNEIDISGSVHTDYLYRTMLANNIAPFGTTGSFLVALPGIVHEGHVLLKGIEEIEKDGHIESADWFRTASAYWDSRKTETNKDTELKDYLNFQNKLEYQKLDARYVVVYCKSGTNAVSAVIDRNSLDLPFIAENIVYHYSLNNEDEAYYMCAFLNSGTANRLVKPFQTRGLQGERDVTKKILSIPFPEFDPREKEHLELAWLGRECAEMSAEFIAAQNFDSQGNNMASGESGRFRSLVRKHLSVQLEKIDRLVEKLLTGRKAKS